MSKIRDLKRQTPLALEELKKQLNSDVEVPCAMSLRSCCSGCMPVSTLPTGLIVNEIGIIFLTEDNAEAENVLVEALSMKSFDAAIPAYAYLTSALNLGILSETAEEAVKDFITSDPRGEIAVNFVAEVGLITK